MQKLTQRWCDKPWDRSMIKYQLSPTLKGLYPLRELRHPSRMLWAKFRHETSLKVYGSWKWGPTIFTQLSKLGSNTIIFNEFLTEKYKEVTLGRTSRTTLMNANYLFNNLPQTYWPPPGIRSQRAKLRQESPGDAQDSHGHHQTKFSTLSQFSATSCWPSLLISWWNRPYL